MVAVIRKGLERFGDEEEGKFCHWKIMGSLSWLLVSFNLLHRFCFRFFDLLCSLWTLEIGCTSVWALKDFNLGGRNSNLTCNVQYMTV
jgi:hypothetical protein